MNKKVFDLKPNLNKKTLYLITYKKLWVFTLYSVLPKLIITIFVVRFIPNVINEL